MNQTGVIHNKSASGVGGTLIDVLNHITRDKSRPITNSQNMCVKLTHILTGPIESEKRRSN